jgi:hypothetical protein
MGGYDLTRNGIGYDGEVLYGLDLDEGARCSVASRFLDRHAFLYAWKREDARGELTPLVCP